MPSLTRKPPLRKSQFVAELAEVILSARKRVMLNQHEVSRGGLGLLTNSLVSSYERGTEPTLSKFIALCIALGKRPEELLPPRVVAMLHGGPTDPAYFGR